MCDNCCGTIGELFDVCVGFVSGRDEVFRCDYGNVTLLMNEDREEKFILCETFPTMDERMNERLLSNKDELLKRKIRNFSEKNWYEWGALRNINKIRDKENEICIYVKTLTRHEKVAFAGKVRYFGGGLLCLIPKREIDDFLMNDIVKFLNGENFRKNYTYSGRFKIGQRQLVNVSV